MSHYYDKVQSSPLREEIVSVNVLGFSFDFFSASGLFSKKELDSATRLLIEKADLTNAKSVLDLGCGWGVVAVSLAVANKNSEIKFVASDVSDRAITYTKKNSRKFKAHVEVIQSNIFENSYFENKLFDVILTNPPYVAGRKVCLAFIEESFNHLNEGGSLQLVARHKKGGKFLGEYMKDLFGNLEFIGKQSGFRIYKSVKKSSN